MKNARLLLLLLSLPLVGCAAWDTWRAGGRKPALDAAAAAKDVCICPVVETMKEGESRDVALDLVVLKAEPGSFDGRCPDSDCDCPPIHVRRPAGAPIAERGRLVRATGLLRHESAGFFLDERAGATPKAMAP